MRFTVTVREEKYGARRIPSMQVGPLIVEAGDKPRINNNAVEWHRRFTEQAKVANRNTREALDCIRTKNEMKCGSKKTA